MAKNAPELIDEHVSVPQVQRAIDALLTHVQKIQEEKAKTELQLGREQHVWLNLTVKQMQAEKKLKPFKIPIVHPLVDPREASICLITKDPQREYKDLLETHKIKFISRVVGVTKLRGKFKGYEEKRMLLEENGMFLADERVIPLLPALLGKKFFQAKKQPIPVCLTRKDLKGELERAISSTYFHQNQGTCSSIKIGVLSQSSSQVLANLQSALPAVIKHIKGGWDNVQSLHIKTSSSVSLPIWTCELGSADGGRWDGLVAEDVDMSGSDDGSDDEAGADAIAEKEVELVAEGKTNKGKKRAAEEEAPTPKKKKAKAEAVGPEASTPAVTLAKDVSTSKVSKPKAQKKKTLEPQVEPKIVETSSKSSNKATSMPKLPKGKKAKKSDELAPEPVVEEIAVEAVSEVVSSPKVPKEKRKKTKAKAAESVPDATPAVEVSAPPTPTPKELKQKRSAVSGNNKNKKRKPSGQTAKETLLGKKGLKA
ncbi:hypothetical protein EUX98_g3593 [Antrodiella citrinella]|uniref:Ribosomal L1 domain-containing protein 1 n=1 Tax=Antrodiella citrinella TaxID=2447956 RepID=A0A4S4MW50_9APHY|nr:hypothetical protein EUX98_g3593 [Antrodiella citrinella]